MPDSGIKKLYYAIGEVCEMLGLEAHVLRYWETEFEQLHPRKNRAGRRAYTDDDIATLKRIQHLLREDKYTIEGARQVLARERDAEDGLMDHRRELLALRGFLETLLHKLPSGE